MSRCCGLRLFPDLDGARRVRNRSSGILRTVSRVVLGCIEGSILFITASPKIVANEVSVVRCISALADPHEARLWSKARRIEQDPASPKEKLRYRHENRVDSVHLHTRLKTGLGFLTTYKRQLRDARNPDKLRLVA